MRTALVVAAATAVGAEEAKSPQKMIEMLKKQGTLFTEDFSGKWEDRWTPSTWKESEKAQGTWSLSAGKSFEDVPDDDENKKEFSGLATTQDHRFYGISAQFEPFSSKKKTLVVSFQVKQDEKQDCGGAYVKIGPPMDDQTQFGDPTPYYIMFGPDTCGHMASAGKTHLIFNYGGKNHEKTQPIDYKQANPLKQSHLYTLTVKPPGVVEVKIDNEFAYEGEMRQDWPILPAEKIEDPEDVKPSDWVDAAFIDDPEDGKPEDWVDEEKIPDPEARKPEDWDDDEDGEWEPATVDNPNYKGPWKTKRVENPKYKGPWKPKLVDNPDYAQDDLHYGFKEIGFVGVDVWQVTAGTVFDNFFICASDPEDDDQSACTIAHEDWVSKWVVQNAAEKELAKKEKGATDATTTTTTTADPAEDFDDDDEDL